MTTPRQTADATWQDALPFLIWRAHHAVHRHLQDALDGLDVTVTQLGLAVHIHEFGRMSASDLARRFHLTPQSVTTALGRLERLDWVRRLPHPVHKKVVWYELTPTGLTSIAVGRSRAAVVNAQLESALEGVDRSALAAGLISLTNALDGAETSPIMWPVVDRRG